MRCIVCNCETRKYKCPKCCEYYCSLNCFKTHKEQPCKKKDNIEEKDQIDKVPVTHLPFKTEDTVNINLLKKLEQNINLKKLLENPHLRNYLTEIDQSPNAWKAMKVAMQEPLFIEFADECLKVVEPQEN